MTRVNCKIRANVEILRELLYDEIYVGNESGSRKQSCLDLSIFNFDQAIKGKRKRKIHSLTSPIPRTNHRHRPRIERSSSPRRKFDEAAQRKDSQERGLAEMETTPLHVLLSRV